MAASLSARGRVPIRKAKVTRRFKSPDGHPNALEATPQGLWVGEQVTDNAYLLDWRNGEILKKVTTESSNTSGLAYGGGYLWMGANGGPLMRDSRPGELKYGRIVKIDPRGGTSRFATAGPRSATTEEPALHCPNPTSTHTAWLE